MDLGVGDGYKLVFDLGGGILKKKRKPRNNVYEILNSFSGSR